MLGQTRTAGLGLLVLLISLLARCHSSDLSLDTVRSQAGRHLLQTASTSLLPVVSPEADGGLSVAGSFAVQENGTDIITDLNTYNLVAVSNGGIYGSDTIRGAGCVDVNGSSADDSLITYYVVVSSSLDAAVANGVALDVSQLDIVPGSQVTSQSVSGVVTLQSTQLYNVLLSGPEDGPDIGYSAVQLGYTIYPPGAPECAAAAPAPATSAPSPAAAAVPYSASLVSSGLLSPFSTNSIGFTGATCISFELLQEIQASSAEGLNVDLSAFVITADDFQNFSASGTPDFSSLSGVCRQTTDSLGSCTSTANGLDPNELYVLLAVNGLYSSAANAIPVSLPVVVRYGAQNSATCTVTFPSDVSSAPGTAPSTAPTAAGPTNAQGPTGTASTGATAQAPVTTPASPAAAVPSPSPPTSTASLASPPVVSGSLGGFSTGV